MSPNFRPRWPWSKLKQNPDIHPELEPELEPEAPSLDHDDYPKKQRRYYTKWHSSAAQSKRLAKILYPIIVGNVILMGCLILVLWGFTQIGDLSKNQTPWIKRMFNVVTILLIAAVAIGIGGLFDQIGHMIRWPLLARRCHSLQEVRPPCSA